MKLNSIPICYTLIIACIIYFWRKKYILISGKDKIKHEYRGKNDEEIKNTIRVEECHIETTKSLNFIPIFAVAATMIVLFINTASGIVNNRDPLNKYKMKDKILIDALSNNNNDFKFKDTILKKNYGNFKNIKYAENDENAKLYESFNKNCSDLRDMEIDSNEVVYKAINLIIDNEAIAYELDDTKFEYTKTVINISVLVILVILMVYYYGNYLFFYRTYKVKILKGILEEHEKEKNILHNDNLEIKHKVLIEIYKEYQNDISNLKIEVLGQKFKLYQHAFRMSLRKLENEELIKKICNDEVIITLNGIRYIEEQFEIQSNIKNINKVKKLKEILKVPEKCL